MALVNTCKRPKFTYGTASGNPCTFNAGLCGLPLEKLLVSFKATQSGSGTPSVDNIREIQLVSRVDLTANSALVAFLLNGEYAAGVVDITTGKLTVLFSSYTITGTERFSTTGTGQHIITVPSLITLGAKAFPITSISTIVCEFAETKTYNSLNVYGDTDGIGIGTSFTIIGTAQYNAWSTLIGKKFIYELEEPVVVQLTPTQLSAVKGQNTISGGAEITDIAAEFLKVSGG